VVRPWDGRVDLDIAVRAFHESLQSPHRTAGRPPVGTQGPPGRATLGPVTPRTRFGPETSALTSTQM